MPFAVGFVFYSPTSWIHVRGPDFQKLRDCMEDPVAEVSSHPTCTPEPWIPGAPVAQGRSWAHGEMVLDVILESSAMSTELPRGRRSSIPPITGKHTSYFRDPKDHINIHKRKDVTFWFQGPIQGWYQKSCFVGSLC